MVPRRYSYHGKKRVEYVFAEASMSLPVIDEHLFKDFLSRDATEAARLGPRLIDNTIP